VIGNYNCVFKPAQATALDLLLFFDVTEQFPALRDSVVDRKTSSATNSNIIAVVTDGHVLQQE
jgi:hypothetical protein